MCHMRVACNLAGLQLVPFIVGFDSMASDPWIDAPGWGNARGQNLGHFIDFFKTLFFSFIESSVFGQQVLFRTDFLSVTSDIRAHDPMWGKRSKSRTPLKCYYIFLTYADIL